MDGSDDAYAAIYDEHDQERMEPSSRDASPASCCAILLVFAIIALIALFF